MSYELYRCLPAYLHHHYLPNFTIVTCLSFLKVSAVISEI